MLRNYKVLFKYTKNSKTTFFSFINKFHRMKFSTIQKGFVAFLLVFTTIAQSTAQTYKLPFVGGTSRTCTQGNGGSTSHSGNEQYAYDFSMPIGTTVVAMRSGRVSMVQQIFADYNCTNPTCINDVNRIVIDHGDGTQALYLHLTKNGSLVSVGQQVVQGQPIGKSGSSGRSTGPHLHIQLSNTCGSWYCPSKPLSFGDVTGGIPRSSISYTSGNYQEAVTDLRLSSNLTVSPNPIIQGGSLTATVSIKNFATAAFSGQIALAWHDNAGNFIADIQTSSTVTLAGNGTQTLQFSKSPMTSNGGTYKLYLKYKANGSTTWVTIPGGNNPLSISVTQLFTLTVSPTTLSTFSTNGGTAVVNVNTNSAAWLVSSNVSWARGAKVGSTVVVTVDRNTLPSARSGVITITAGTLSRQIAVSQVAYVPPVPANDNACGAYSAGVNTSFSANTVGATTSPNAPTSCYLGTGKDVWFRFVATTTAATITATNGATIALYSGSCSSPTGVACASNRLVKTGLTRNTTYYIRVWLPNGSTGTIGMGLSSAANVIGGGSNTEGVAGMTQKLEFGNLVISPNPASDILTFSFESDIEAEATYQLFDLTGKVVWSNKVTLQKSKNTQDVDVSALANGTYQLRIQSEQKELLIQQVVVAR